MSYETEDMLTGCVVGCAGVFAVSILLGMVILLVAMFMTPIGCDARWGDVPHRWVFMGGCLIQTPEGQWVPDNHYVVNYIEGENK